MSVKIDQQAAHGLAPDTRSEQQRLFGIALNEELDIIGFPGKPDRGFAFANELGVGRSQAYRILNGTSFPDLAGLLKLRTMGVSLDRCVDKCLAPKPRINLQFGPTLLPTVVEPAGAGQSTVYVVPDKAGFVLRNIASNETPPANALCIYSISFPSMPTIAVVEDNPETLELLSRQLTTEFRVAGFATGTALLQYGPQHFSGLVIDWRLPDMDGMELVRSIRNMTKARICILTGDTSAISALSNALDLPDVDFLPKPANEAILAKLLKRAVSQRP